MLKWGDFGGGHRLVLSILNASIWYLDDHMPMLVSLGKDWAARRPTIPLYQFVPSFVKMDVEFLGFHVYGHVNSNNIIDVPNDFSSNGAYLPSTHLNSQSFHSDLLAVFSCSALLELCGESLHFKFRLPWNKPKEPLTEIYFSAKVTVVWHQSFSHNLLINDRLKTQMVSFDFLPRLTYT